MSNTINRENSGATSDFRDTGVLVAGGASGLGEATVRRLHASGAHVVIADRNSARAQSIADELGPGAVSTACDVTNADDVEAAVSLAANSPRGLRLVVVCAGIGSEGSMVGENGNPHPLESFDIHLKVNLSGAFNVVRLAVSKMHKNEPDSDGERGLVVLTGSVNAFEGAPGEVQYSASKGGVHAMTLPIARELAQWGIRVNTIAPGPFATGMMDEQSEELSERYTENIAFPKRFGRPSEFAILVEHLYLNQMINGSIIRVDGAGSYG